MAERTVAVRLKAITDQYDKAITESSRKTASMSNEVKEMIGRPVAR